MSETNWPIMDDILQVTQAAAIACYEQVGRGDPKKADQQAVTAMREAFKKLPIKGTVVIGEGERDQAPMLYIGEKVGRWQNNHSEFDIAVDPLEGTNLCAKAVNGAWTVLAMAEKQNLFHAPDIYMEKIACGPKAKGLVSLEQSPEENIQKTAEALNKEQSQITVAVLDRPRHKKLIQSIYKAGARVKLIEDGDLLASMLTCYSRKSIGGIDLVMGVGGAPEGVLSASALTCLEGDFQGRLVFQNAEQKQRAKKMGIEIGDKIYNIDDLCKGPVVFCATAVTSGPLLVSITKSDLSYRTESLYMDSLTNEYVIATS